MEVRVIILVSQMHEGTLLKIYFNWQFMFVMTKNLFYLHASFTWQEHPIVFVKLWELSIMICQRDLFQL